tara:strand:+ start:133 stop:264 length:132 start_codon:yes stop_codon:yes gene_type:complete
MDKMKTGYAASKKKKVKAGTHMMNGKMMKDSDMKTTTKKAGKK